MTREARRAYDASRRKGGPRERTRSNASAHGARTKARAEHVVRFVGVDGEGVTRPDGRHDYNLLSIGARSFHHPDGRALSFDDVAGFLWECHEADPQAVMVGFFLGYDFAQWLRRLPEERARGLLTEAGQAARRPRSATRKINPVPFPVRWGPWEFDLLPNMRRFKLRPSHVGTGFCSECGAARDSEGRLKNPHPWAYVCDVGPFFQCSLLKAIHPKGWPDDPIVTAAEYAELEAGKLARGEGTVPEGTPVDRTTIAYNVLENDVLARVMDRYNVGLVASGVRLSRTQWHGPGQAAQEWLKLTAPDHTAEEWRAQSEWDRKPYEAAMASYFGGWFEIPVHGPVPGPSWEYDVNSAYPHIIAGLPCLRPSHGWWLWGEGHKPDKERAAAWGLSVTELRRGSKYRLVHASVEGRNPYLGAMLHRNPKGSVSRPDRSDGWYWWPELQAAKKAGLVHRVHVHTVWQWRPSCDCAPPFRAIADLYRQRLQVGKNTAHGKALKLVYNSAYGKMAQSVGAPMFANPVYASLITSGCRTMILDAIATHPEGPAAVLMVATDGVYFRSRHPNLTIDPERLGAWDETELHDLTLFKPGMYWHRESRRRVFKSRGVNERALAAVVHRLDAQWKRRRQTDPELIRPDMGWWPATTITIPFSIVSPKQALNRNRWELCGALAENLTATNSSWPGLKRDPRPFPQGDGLMRSRVRQNIGWTPSTPYDRRFGMELAEAMAELQALTPDGDAQMALLEALGMRG